VNDCGDDLVIVRCSNHSTKNGHDHHDHEKDHLLLEDSQPLVMVAIAMKVLAERM
jgi:hypothetical protein